MKRKVLSGILDLAVWIAGCFCYAAAVTVLLSANEISPGGFTGIATVLNYLFMLPTGITLFLLNIPVLIGGWLVFGGIFIIKTAIVTGMVSGMLEITEAFLPAYPMDRTLAAVVGGMLMGFGLSLILQRGATTGGVEIIAKLLNRRFPHLTVGKLMLLSDAVVVALAVLVYKNMESALYSVVALYASSRVMDMMLYGADKGKIFYIITNAASEIADEVMHVIHRGVTILNVVGGYTGTDKKMILCTVRRHEVSAMYAIIRRCDPTAFVVLGEAGEILGEGFKKIK